MKYLSQYNQVEGKTIFMHGYLIYSISSLILLLAPSESIDKNIYTIVIASIFMIVCIIFPFFMVCKCSKPKPEDETYERSMKLQRLTLAIYFVKRVMFVVLSFFVKDNLFQSLAIVAMYFLSMVIFSNFKPLGT